MPYSHAYGLVIDSPTVMIKIRRLFTGSLEEGKKVVTFAYGCACHALSLFIKDMITLDNFKDVFKSALNMASYFKKVHLAN